MPRRQSTNDLPSGNAQKNQRNQQNVSRIIREELSSEDPQQNQHNRQNVPDGILQRGRIKSLKLQMPSPTSPLRCRFPHACRAELARNVPSGLAKTRDLAEMACVENVCSWRADELAVMAAVGQSISSIGHLQATKSLPQARSGAPWVLLLLSEITLARSLAAKHVLPCGRLRGSRDPASCVNSR
jgi:hypothetical protein